MTLENVSPANTARTDLSYLHPDRLRLGGTGVFALECTVADGPSGRHIPIGFVGVFIDTWLGWSVFACSRDVVEAIVAEQERLRSVRRTVLEAKNLNATDLRARLDAAITPMSFDGVDIVIDERQVLGTEGLLRIAPADDGRYVVGWSWTWTPVDPAACDIIAGTIPPRGQHQEFVVFTHSPVRAPHDRLAVTAIDHLATRSGIAYTARLTLDGTLVGTIENAGQGGMIDFHPHGREFTRDDLARFAAACRWAGQPTDGERILEAIISEYDVSRTIRDAEAHDAYMVRLLGANDETVTLHALHNPRPRGYAARNALAEYLTAAEGAHPAHLREFRWQIWNGETWAQLATVPNTTGDAYPLPRPRRRQLPTGQALIDTVFADDPIDTTTAGSEQHQG